VHVVATAGHVDHGKSTLVRALTGSDPDRLEEERRRGLSIELGYCWTELPGVGDVAFVDVPGHQRFLTTALAGVGPVPVAMLVVAADDPWMPQAAEHLASLDALGVRHGLLAVTRADLADPGPALSRARDELSRTSLAGAPAVVVSGRTGAGVEELRRRLADVLRAVPAPDPDADVRLWVDRKFHVRGAGTIVTGTLAAGTVRVGDTLEVGGDEVRVRGLESLGVERDAVTAVARVALRLGGRHPGSLARGTALVTPGAFLDTALVDVRLAGDAPLPRQPVLHVGSAHVGVRVRPLGDRFGRLSLDHPLPLRVGDRALLRDPGSRATWGVTVLDPLPPPLSRRGAAADRARALDTHDGTLAAELRLRGTVDRVTLRRLGVPAEGAPPGTVSAGDWLVDPERAATLRTELRDLVRVRATPLAPGLPVPEAVRALGVPSGAVVEALAADDLSVARGEVAETSVTLPAALQGAVDRLRAHLEPAPFAAPAADVLREWGLDAGSVSALHRSGVVLRLADGVVLLPTAADEAVVRLATLGQPFTASEARRALGTSRRVVLPLLAHLDASGRTVRLPDDSRRLR
jgi:selenocysteine-specific elongation factor